MSPSWSRRGVSWKEDRRADGRARAHRRARTVPAAAGSQTDCSKASCRPTKSAFERRRITVLFADMVGFTDLAESLEPEELAEVLNGYLREMTAAVIACGGSVDNMIGDGVMAVFGAPEEMPEADQAWAAVRAAMEMQARCHGVGDVAPGPRHPRRSRHQGGRQHRTLHGGRVRERGDACVHGGGVRGQRRSATADRGRTRHDPLRLPYLRLGEGKVKARGTGSAHGERRPPPGRGVGDRRLGGVVVQSAGVVAR